MIASLTYRIRLDDGDTGEELSQRLLNSHRRITRMGLGRKVLLGLSAEIEGRTIAVKMRVSGMGRTDIHVNARKLVMRLYRGSGVKFRSPLHPELFQVEADTRSLTIGEGRAHTPRGQAQLRSATGGTLQDH